MVERGPKLRAAIVHPATMMSGTEPNRGRAIDWLSTLIGRPTATAILME
jgi:hypothetical protein